MLWRLEEHLPFPNYRKSRRLGGIYRRVILLGITGSDWMRFEAEHGPLVHVRDQTGWQ